MVKQVLKFHVPNGKSYTVIEVDGVYRLKSNRDIVIMINSNRNTRYISDENAMEIKDNLLGASNNSLYHLLFYNTAENRGLNLKKSLRGIEIVR